MNTSSTLKVESKKRSSNIRCRNEKTFVLKTSQIKDLYGRFYDFIFDHSLPKWISVLWGIGSPIIALTFPYIVEYADFKSILFIPKNAVRYSCYIAFGLALIACLVSFAGRLYFLCKKHHALTRKKAISWACKQTDKYCCDDTSEIVYDAISF